MCQQVLRVHYEICCLLPEAAPTVENIDGSDIGGIVYRCAAHVPNADLLANSVVSVDQFGTYVSILLVACVETSLQFKRAVVDRTAHCSAPESASRLRRKLNSARIACTDLLPLAQNDLKNCEEYDNNNV